jgi:hypothetical protein
MGGRKDSEQQQQQTHAEQRKRSREEAGASAGREYKQNTTTKRLPYRSPASREREQQCGIRNEKREVKNRGMEERSHGEANKKKNARCDSRRKNDKDSAADRCTESTAERS